MGKGNFVYWRGRGLEVFLEMRSVEWRYNFEFLFLMEIRRNFYFINT